MVNVIVFLSHNNYQVIEMVMVLDNKNGDLEELQGYDALGEAVYHLKLSANVCFFMEHEVGGGIYWVIPESWTESCLSFKTIKKDS